LVLLKFSYTCHSPLIETLAVDHDLLVVGRRSPLAGAVLDVRRGAVARWRREAPARAGTLDQHIGHGARRHSATFTSANAATKASAAANIRPDIDLLPSTTMNA
jgi:hypothetical protein